MGKGKLTPEDLEILRENQWIKKIASNDSRIVWKESFKEHFINEYIAGKPPIEIFEEAGFTSKLLGYKRIERAAARWRKMYNVPVHEGAVFKKKEKNKIK